MFQVLTTSVNSEPVEAGVIDVPVVGENVELDELKGAIGRRRLEHLYRITVVVVGEPAEIDRVRVLVRVLQTENDEIFRRRVDGSGGRHRFRDVFDRKPGRTHRGGQLDHQVTLGALESPALPRQDTRLKNKSK